MSSSDNLEDSFGFATHTKTTSNPGLYCFNRWMVVWGPGLTELSLDSLAKSVASTAAMIMRVFALPPPEEPVRGQHLLGGVHRSVSCERCIIACGRCCHAPIHRAARTGGTWARFK